MNEPWYATAFGAHYPLLYAHRDQEEARQCLALLPRLAPFAAAGLVLDLGCGDGRHLSQLGKSGYQAVGLDLSPHLLAAAQSRIDRNPLRLVRGDMRILPFSSGSLSEVLSLFTAFGYFGTLRDNLGVIDEVQRVLCRGGHWFLDYVDCDKVRNELRGLAMDTRDRELGPLSVRETRRLVDGEHRVVKDVALVPLAEQAAEALSWGVGPEGVHYTESVALFSVAEFKEQALKLGLNLAASAGSYQGVPLGQGNRWIMVFRKN